MSQYQKLLLIINPALRHSPAINHAAALAKASTITDQGERSKLYKRFQELFHEDVAGLLFANAQAFTPVRKDVKDYKIHFFGGQPFFGVSIAK